MWDVNTLAVRYYLEDLERAAKHDIAQQKHRQRTGSFHSLFSDLMRFVGSAFSPFAGKPSSRSEQAVAAPVNQHRILTGIKTTNPRLLAQHRVVG